MQAMPKDKGKTTHSSGPAVILDRILTATVLREGTDVAVVTRCKEVRSSVKFVYPLRSLNSTASLLACFDAVQYFHSAYPFYHQHRCAGR